MNDNNELKNKIFAEIAKVPDFPKIYPSWVSVGPVPIRLNTRRLYSYPKIVELFVEYLAPMIAESKVNLIAGAETAGIPLAMALSLKTRIPFIYVRKEEKIKGNVSQGCIEGDFKAGDKAVLVDDLLGNGKTKLLLIENLKKAGVEVKSIVMIMTTKNKLLAGFKDMIEQRHISLFKIYTWDELTSFQIDQGIIPKEIAPLVLDYMQNPDSWNDNARKWQSYCQALKNLNIEIPDFLKKYAAES
ncbi:MAG: phosphoribosyltransferase family protein [Candidatus Buchananbacteria bacterium]